MRRNLPLSRVYALLEPGPVVLVTTARGGRPNVMTMSWHTMMEFEPPTIGCVISNRNYTFETLRSTRQCAINIPSVEIARKVVRCGNASGRKVDKFERFGLTPAPAATIDAPLIAECFANLECRLLDDRLVDDYCFFILEVVKAWIDPNRKNAETIHHRGRGVFAVDGKVVKLPSRMK